MAEESLFRNIIEFFVEIGVYDVLLPFLLVFAIVYAIFDKTRVLGTDNYEGHEIPKKNINAMIAFVIGFLVVVSKQLVATINQALANVVLLLILIVMFLMLVGVFFKKDEDIALTGGWRITFMIAILVSIVLIFFDAIKVRSGDISWLQWGWRWIESNWSGNAFGSVVMLILVIVLIMLITWDKNPSPKVDHDHK
jgi:lysylphosphatidylglycerol synthetase-like protein (DUF2156 family)